jgi:nicotinamidase-related amidase
VIDRTTINTWEDPKVVDAVKATGRKQLIIAGLWTEICVAMPALQAAGEGWDVTVITDASGGDGGRSGPKAACEPTRVIPVACDARQILRFRRTR